MHILTNFSCTCADFFLVLQENGITEPNDIPNAIEDKQIFALPEQHLYYGRDYHVMLMVFSAIKLLNFGTVPFERLLDEDTFLPELYAEHMIAMIYMMLTEFFLSDGKELFTGSRCMYALTCLLICFNMPVNML